MSCKVLTTTISDELKEKIDKEVRIEIEANKYAYGGNSRTLYPYFIDDKDYIHLPFAYSYRTLKMPKPESSTFPSANIVFKGSLYPEQEEVKKEALSILNKKKSVKLSMYCGFGKTITSIKIASKTKLKVVAIVNKIILMNQWVASVETFAPGTKIQKLTPKCKPDPDCDFFVINAINVPKIPMRFWDKIGVCIFDECFPYDTAILTPSGYILIGEIYDNDSKPLVLSFNEKTKQFENKKIIRSYRKLLTSSLLTITFWSGNRKIKCTDNHKFLTSKGYKKAIELQNNDLIISYRNDIDSGDITQALNDDQKQIIYGSFLGDGCISKLRSGRYRLRLTHGYKQKEYCEWKASMFKSSIRYIEKNGYAQKSAVGVTTSSFDMENDFPKIKSECPQWLINSIDERALAIWYMDDGTINKVGNSITLYTNSFSDESVERLITCLNDRFGIQSLLCRDKHYPIIRITNKNTKKFLKLVAPYMHKNIIYKLHTVEFLKQVEDSKKGINDIFTRKEYISNNKLVDGHIYKAFCGKKIKSYKWEYCNKCDCNKCDCNKFHLQEKTQHNNIYWRCIHSKNLCNIPFHINFKEYKWNNNYLKYGYLKVKDVYLNINTPEKYVYDIEVEDNHNFITCSKTGLNGPVVHNCHLLMTERLSESCQYIHPRYLIGLSATPYRTDGFDPLIDLYFGKDKIVRELNRKHIVYQVETGFVPTVEATKSGTVNWGVVLRSQADDEERNKLLLDIIKHYKERTFLVMCKLVDQANYLFNKLKEDGESVTSLIGKQQEFDSDARILVCISSKCSTGFDHKKVDALLMAADLESYFIQVLGRVFRTKEVVPIVFDLIDNNGILKKHARTRKAVYLECGGTVKHFDIKVLQEPEVN